MNEPSKSGPDGGARWAAYLDFFREHIAAAVLSVPYDDQRTSRVPSGWTPLELLSHVIHMEQRWFVWGFLGEPVDEPWGDWNVEEPWGPDDGSRVAPGARWVVPAEVTAEELVERLRAGGERTGRVLVEHDLSTPARTGGQFDADPPTLEWICFHVMKEYAMHAGHLEIAVELRGE